MFTNTDIPESVTLSKGRRACRRQANELRVAYQLHRQFAEFAKESDTSDELPKEHGQSGRRELFKLEELAEKCEWLAQLTGDNQKALLKLLEKLEKAGPLRNVATAPSPLVLDVLNRDFPNFIAVTTLIQRRLMLCRIAPDQHIKLPPILINGPAGVGKTAYCQRLAKLLAMRFENFDLSSGSASFALTGLEAGFATGHPGRIWESLQHDSMSVLWLLDEVEKVKQDSNHGGNQFLLGLLESVSATRFMDNCTLLPIDASWIFYIATSNDKILIDKPLLSRFEVFDVAAPDVSQLRAIVSSIYRDIRASEGWAPAFCETLGEGVIDALNGFTSREIRRALINGFAVAAGQSRRALTAGDVVTNADRHTHGVRRIGFI